MLKQKHGDSLVAIFVLVIILMLIIPLPTFLLDFLLAFNIGFSLLLLLVGLYMTSVTSLLAFPSLLLLTTLFRLGLNVASTRLILSQGDAGRVIEAFGNFLIRGEVLVGIIIFSIITIVNFIVIAKGSARVSEVAARFTLEAIPGKQMAIDSDLRSNLINPQMAQKRREDLRKESQLYGSMDGAMKFVQGDAIAGFFIIFTNIIGGIYLGVRTGMSFSDAINTYTILTVGDGLVSQIPALMISICAGIVVTRVSSEEGSTLGSDLFRQIFHSPAILFISGIIVLFLSFLPSIPMLPFLMVSMSLFLASRWIARQQVGNSEVSLLSDGNIGLIKGNIKIELDTKNLFPIFTNNSQAFYKIYSREIKEFSERTGLLLDFPTVSSNSMSNAGFRIVFKNKVWEEIIPADCTFIYASPSAIQEIGLELVNVSYFDNYIPGVWVKNSEIVSKIANEKLFTCLSPLVYVIHRLFESAQNNSEQILGMTYVNNRIKDLNQVDQSLVVEARLADFFTGSRVTDILHDLIKQRISIRDFKGIVEMLARYASRYRSTLLAQDEFDKVDIVNFIRQQQKQESKNTSLACVVLSNEMEDLFIKSKLESSTGVLMLDDEKRANLENNLQQLVNTIWLKGNNYYQIICRADIRHKIVAFLNSIDSTLAVIALEELYPSSKIEVVGIWKMN